MPIETEGKKFSQSFEESDNKKRFNNLRSTDRYL